MKKSLQITGLVSHRDSDFILAVWSLLLLPQCLETACLLAFSMLILHADNGEPFPVTHKQASWTSFPLNMIRATVTQAKQEDAAPMTIYTSVLE